MEGMKKTSEERGGGVQNELVIRYGPRWEGLVRLSRAWWCIVRYDLCRLHS